MVAQKISTYAERRMSFQPFGTTLKQLLNLHPAIRLSNTSGEKSESSSKPDSPESAESKSLSVESSAKGFWELNVLLSRGLIKLTN
jgi:hypothetical protein